MPLLSFHTSCNGQFWKYFSYDQSAAFEGDDKNEAESIYQQIFIHQVIFTFKKCLPYYQLVQIIKAGPIAKIIQTKYLLCLNIKERQYYIGEMSDRLRKFNERLTHTHYSSAFVQHLVEIITQNPKINTLQQIYQVIQKESQLIIDHFNNEESDIKLLQFRNPLCFQSIRDYFHTMTRSVYKKYGNNIEKFKEGLKVVAKDLIDIMAASTSKIVKHSQYILKDCTAKKILVYSYSKSIALSLKKLAKSLEENLTVYVCKSGSLEQGIKLYEELVLEGIKCNLINDNEVGYYIHQITCVLVGAQVILDNGAILNRAGTSIIALLAHAARKPFYVFAQSYKFVKKIFLCQRDIPQRYSEDKERKVKTISIDLTLPEYITMFCTDNGLYNPQIIALELGKILK